MRVVWVCIEQDADNNNRDDQVQDVQNDDNQNEDIYVTDIETIQESDSESINDVNLKQPCLYRYVRKTNASSKYTTYK